MRPSDNPPLDFDAGDPAPAERTSPQQGTSPPTERRSPWVQLRSASLHPFVYRKMVREADSQARPGDIVSLYDKSGQYFGQGLYNPRSQIVVRVLTCQDVPIDDEFWRGRLRQAVELRRRLRIDESTDACRLVHAEGDDLSGLIVERYADVLVLEVFSLGMHRRAELICRLAGELLGPPKSLDRPGHVGERWRAALRVDDRVERLEGFRAARTIPGHPELPPTRVVIREHGIRYAVDVRHGHKTGFFCDQRENRRRLADLCGGACVLDVCCYTGGFSLGAKLRGDAREVTGVDLDEAAVAAARENADLNQTRVQFVHADAFTYMRQMLANGRQFDVVVLDPPKLATYRQEVTEALRKYHDLNLLAMQVTRPGGVLLTCSCSGLVSRADFTDAVRRAAQHAHRSAQLFDETGAAPDHPVRLNCPESAYLTALWFRIL